jgi:hypothetical protein
VLVDEAPLRLNGDRSAPLASEQADEIQTISQISSVLIERRRMSQSTSTLSAGGIELTPRVALRQREDRMVLATAKVADFDQFWNVFSTQGAEKRGQHGSKGANVFRDPNDADRVWVVFDWDDAGWQSFTSDPDVPAIFQQAGFTEGPPKAAEFVREHPA